MNGRAYYKKEHPRNFDVLLVQVGDKEEHYASDKT
jgi:hypothetical protein